MPCDSIRTVSVDLSSIGKIDINLLAAALNELGLHARVIGTGQAAYISHDYGTYARGELTTNQNSYSRVTVDQVKREYSRQVVMSQCKRYGWAYKETERGQFLVTKR